MATHTLGTTANNSLTSVTYNPGYGSGLLAADIATIAIGILDDISNSHPNYGGAFSSNGILYVPNRGQLKMLPGDVVAIDSATGWPILVSKRAIASGPWTFT